MTRKHKIKFGRFEIPMPASRIVRIGMGVGLILAGGIFGWLPLLGYWMVPLGLIILSIDLAIARRWRRNIEVWWGRRKAAKAAR